MNHLNSKVNYRLTKNGNYGKGYIWSKNLKFEDVYEAHILHMKQKGRTKYLRDKNKNCMIKKK